ncbi:biotin transporter BioY [Acuticoccus sp. M5D2P5]|uniref:biotin transporter BioY n=1 Tax=Acuticoccus kalidii TaxID=2910977 RepID=UPI001F1CFCE9|nr:biotin transporter BioY [Acuticoccus kalidii]MCF3934227.1 biotin transporter BioY [Acuticoccus kalidii]
MTTRSAPVLADRLLTPSLARNVMLAVAGSLVLWVSAKVHVPMYPVPMTMQTFAITVIGMAFGWRLAAATVALYLAQGAMGLPVFSGTPERGLGLAYMMGPTGGYLIGFFLAAVVTGWLAERGWDRRVSTTLAAMTIGTAIILATGTLYLGALIGWDKPVLALGLTPFIAASIVKIALGTAVMPFAWNLIERFSR